MNIQSEPSELQKISKEDAFTLLNEQYPNEFNLVHLSVLNYAAFPVQYTNTSGPFKKAGGRSMSTYTIETWFYKNTALFFCKGEVIEITENFSLSLKKYDILFKF